MKSEAKDPLASLIARLKIKARALNAPEQEVFEHYAIAGFLHRLSKSEYRDQFVLKGGLAFLGWGMALRRSTRDIDLQAVADNSPEALVAIVKAVCDQPVTSDFLIFDLAAVRYAPIILQAEQPGVRIKLTARLSNIVAPMQIDFSFANVITPGPIQMDYPYPLGNRTSSLQGYPPETSIAEKVEAMVTWGMSNARLKDYFDIWLLSQERSFEGPVLLQAILATFQNRGTSIPLELPESLSPEFAQKQQKQWTAFLRKLRGASGELASFSLFVANIQEFVLPVLQAAAHHEPFKRNWTPNKQWHR